MSTERKPVDRDRAHVAFCLQLAEERARDAEYIETYAKSTSERTRAKASREHYEGVANRLRYELAALKGAASHG